MKWLEVMNAHHKNYIDGKVNVQSNFFKMLDERGLKYLWVARLIITYM